jgi:hypothetical protein
MIKRTKTGGRKKGSRNRTTREIQLSLLKLFDDNLSSLQADFESMQGKDRATLMISLAKHIIPPALQPDRLSEAQIIEIITYLKNQNEQV